MINCIHMYVLYKIASYIVLKVVETRQNFNNNVQCNCTNVSVLQCTRIQLHADGTVHVHDDNVTLRTCTLYMYAHRNIIIISLSRARIQIIL